MPKQGTRTFQNVLRAFGIRGAEGRRLSFALGNDVSPIVDADRYDPLPFFMATSPFAGQLAPGAGRFNFFRLTAPARSHVLIHKFMLQGGTGVFHGPILFFIEDLATLTAILLPITVEPASGSGLQSGSVVSVGNTTFDGTTLPHNVAHVATTDQQVIGSFGQGFVVAPGRTVVIQFDDDTSTTRLGFWWTEVTEPPARGE